MRVLVVRLSSLGDVVHAAPVLADIRRHRPEARVDWVVEEALVPLVRCLAGVERIVPIALRRWRKSPLDSLGEIRAFARLLRAEAYDLVIDLQGLVKSALVTRAARLAAGGRRVGMANQTDGAAYEPAARLAYDEAFSMTPRIHVVDRSRQVAARALGYPLDDAPVVPWQVPALNPDDARWADPRAVLLVHGSAKAVKQLPTSLWVALAHALVSRGDRVLLSWGSDDERDRAEAIAAEVGDGAAVLPRLPLDRLAAVMLGQRGCIGVDTGLAHMAATLGRPTVQLFIEDKAWRAGAYWQPCTVVLQATSDAPLTVEGVMSAWDRVA